MTCMLINAWHTWKWMNTFSRSLLRDSVPWFIHCCCSNDFTLVEVIHVSVMPRCHRTIALFNLRPFIPFNNKIVVIRDVGIRKIRLTAHPWSGGPWGSTTICEYFPMPNMILTFGNSDVVFVFFIFLGCFWGFLLPLSCLDSFISFFDFGFAFLHLHFGLGFLFFSLCYTLSHIMWQPSPFIGSILWWPWSARNATKSSFINTVWMSTFVQFHPFTVIIEVDDVVTSFSHGVMFRSSFGNLHIWMSWLINAWRSRTGWMITCI